MDTINCFWKLISPKHKVASNKNETGWKNSRGNSSRNHYIKSKVSKFSVKFQMHYFTDCHTTFHTVFLLRVLFLKSRGIKHFLLKFCYVVKFFFRILTYAFSFTLIFTIQENFLQIHKISKFIFFPEQLWT